MRKSIAGQGCVLAAVALLLFSSPALAQEAGNPPPPAVETAAVKLAPVTRQVEFIGTVESVQQVDLRARVEGFLESVNFKEGSFVPEGTLVFEIEKDTYQAALDGAKATLQAANAQLAGAQATLKQAEVNLTRQISLLKTAAVSQATVDDATASRDTAQASVLQAQAQIAQAQSQVETAQLNLSYTDVKTPISGRIGKAYVTEGNLVSPSTGPLATVIQTDPIRVVFSISDRDYLQVVDVLKPNDQGFSTDPAHYQPRLRLSDGSEYASPGKITFMDNSINTTTGTIAVYAEFPNPHLQLVPGQFVGVTVQDGKAQELPVIPAAAVQQDRDGSYVFVLDNENRAVIRRVTLAERAGTDWAVSAGLANGEVVIVSGVQKVRPGIVVAPHPAAGN
ncbi:MAG: efflux RND transporter periplasmic adaptor subunit [Rhizobiaceae bacterium]|nr:efflux RND transporter periplasmic adaptor subunit [Rhizobiaceae bacterium]